MTAAIRLQELSMTRTLLAAAFLLAACNTKPTWHPHAVGPISMEFPCEPTTTAARTKCMRPDGTEYALTVVDKTIPVEQELKETAEYARQLPKSEVFEGSKFPLRWREVRQFRRLDSWLFYGDGKEYTATVDYSTDALPATGEEFFSRIKVK
jgi:hypothetical protein